MDEYLVPTQFGEDEFIEKKSRFIGRVWPVETEEEALEKIQAMKKQHYDATHNCWAYIIKDGAVRFSDNCNGRKLLLFCIQRHTTTNRKLHSHRGGRSFF